MASAQTGYSVYNEEQRKRTKQNTLEDLYPELPKKKFDIIYADPPWHYNGKMQFDKSSKSREKIDLSKKIFISSAAFKYPTLKTKELMKLEVESIAGPAGHYDLEGLLINRIQLRKVGARFDALTQLVEPAA